MQRTILHLKINDVSTFNANSFHRPTLGLKFDKVAGTAFHFEKSIPKQKPIAAEASYTIIFKKSCVENRYVK